MKATLALILGLVLFSSTGQARTVWGYVCDVTSSKSNLTYRGQGYTQDEALAWARYSCNADPNPFGPLCNKYASTTNCYQALIRVGHRPYPRPAPQPYPQPAPQLITCEVVSSKSNRSYYGQGYTQEQATANAKAQCNADPNPYGPLCNKYAWTVNCY
jgi:hypothetical protein